MRVVVPWHEGMTYLRVPVSGWRSMMSLGKRSERVCSVYQGTPVAPPPSPKLAWYSLGRGFVLLCVASLLLHSVGGRVPVNNSTPVAPQPPQPQSPVLSDWAKPSSAPSAQVSIAQVVWCLISPPPPIYSPGGINKSGPLCLYRFSKKAWNPRIVQRTAWQLVVLGKMYF